MYIVTGVSGNFGAVAAELLLETIPADKLIFTSSDVTKLEKWRARGVDVRAADFDDLQQTTEAFSGGDVLLLVSTMLVGPRRRAQHKNAVDAAVAAGVTRIVYTSYLGSDDETNEAIVTVDHRETEKIILASGLSYNFMRDSQYAEAMTQQQAAAAIQSGQMFANQGSGVVGFVSRDDCARVAVALLLGGGERDRAYDVTGPELLSYRQICALISEISGAAIAYNDVTDEQFYGMWDAMGVPRESTGDFTNSPFPWCSDDMVSFGRAIREGMMEVLSGSVEELTGTKPTTMRELMLAERAHWPVPEATAAV
jgi:NAD(P)H dehydrogenase (quinone)